MKDKKGVTLIELIVSMTIFAVVVAGIALFNASNTRSVTRSERKAKTVILQEKTTEEFRVWLRSNTDIGPRFDSIWVNGEKGDSIYGKKDTNMGISSKVEIDSFIPDNTVDVKDDGVRLQVRLISADEVLNNKDTTLVLLSWHN